MGRPISPNRARPGRAGRWWAADAYDGMCPIFWSITLVVAVKHVVFILRADNDGEGVIMRHRQGSRRPSRIPEPSPAIISTVAAASQTRLMSTGRSS
jgi:K+ transporter